MAPRQIKTITYTGLKGRDGYPTYPGLIPKHKALEMFNVDGYRAGVARKRGGSTNIFSSTTSEAFTGTISALARWVPGSSITAAEFWGVDNASTPVVQRLAGGTAWASPTLTDNFTAADVADIVMVGYGGRLYIAGNTAQDRLHVYDPTDTKVRRTGLATPSAPTVADTGSGSYAATLRYYKQRYAKKSGSTYLSYSELSASVSFTPSGSGTHARITKSAGLSEDETHWQIFASPDNLTYFYLAETAVGTTTYDDNTAPADYTGDAPPLAGTYTNWTSVKHLLATDDHLLGMGAWETSGAKYSRVWWSAVTNQITDGTGDPTVNAEAVIQTTEVKNYIDLAEGTGGDGTGLGGPIDGRPLVFKRYEYFRLVPTGIDSAFYDPKPVMKGSGVGCLRHHTIVNAEDAAGRPCVYWLSDFGPYRHGSEGPQCLVDDIQDLWDTINLAASNVVAHGTYYPALKQVWWWIATGSSNDPDTKIVFDVRSGRVYEDGRVRDGWYRHSGDSAAARCSCMFSNTLSASMSRDLKPHIGRSSGTVILKCDTTDLDDAGTTYQAYVDLPDTHFGGIDHLCEIGTPIVVGSAGAYNIAATIVRDYGEETRGAATVDMTAGGSETRTTKIIEGVETADAHAARIRIGDSEAIADVLWRIDAIGIPVEQRESIL